MQELNLIGMINALETDLAIATKQEWSHEELLLRLLQSERVYRPRSQVSLHSPSGDKNFSRVGIFYKFWLKRQVNQVGRDKMA